MKTPPLIAVKSTNVEAIGWHGGSLFVRFKGGGLYTYADVPETVYHEGLASDSPGKWFRSSVSGSFKHKKHDA